MASAGDGGWIARKFLLDKLRNKKQISQQKQQTRKTNVEERKKNAGSSVKILRFRTANVDASVSQKMDAI